MMHLYTVWQFTTHLLLVIAAASGQSTETRLTTLEERVTCLQSTLDGIGVGNRPRDCRDVYNHISHENGVYLIWPDGSSTSNPLHVLCNFDDDGQWIVLQRRVNGDVAFQRDWASYRDGFGRMSNNSDFWLGLEQMHLITSQQIFTLRIDLVGWDDRTVYAEYSIFFVKNEQAKYAIYYDEYSGSAGDALGDAHRGMRFTTIDQDNDNYHRNCAETDKGGWWFNRCDRVNLNGEYGGEKGNLGMEWGESTVWRTSSMRIKPTYDF